MAAAVGKYNTGGGTDPKNILILDTSYIVQYIYYIICDILTKSILCNMLTSSCSSIYFLSSDKNSIRGFEIQQIQITEQHYPTKKYEK